MTVVTALLVPPPVPMAARVVQVDPDNYLLMHAMGPNVAGVIGTAIAVGALLSFLG